MSLQSKRINVWMSLELISKIDSVVDTLYIDRSEFIRQAIYDKLRNYTVNPQPSVAGFNVLMTDQQLDEMSEIIRLERRRRNIHHHPS